MHLSQPQQYETRNQLQEKDCKKKDVEAKQYAKQPVCHWRNQREKFKIPEDKRKWKHNNLTLMTFLLISVS